MKLESPDFTQTDLDRFLDEQVDRERVLLADRLEKASDRLVAVAQRITPGGDAGASWTNHEVLAHIAVLSKFYGVMVHRVAAGQLTEVDLLASVNLRDVAGQQMSALGPEELLDAIRADHARTVKLLRTVEPAALRRSVGLSSGERVTAEFIARHPLVSHLEEHVGQLERALA